jgi:phage tail-like protein
MATVINNRSNIITDPLRNFRYLVTFMPQDNNNTDMQNLSKISFGFTSVSGLAVQTDAIPYREGGFNTTVHQLPGQTSFAPVQLSRGMVLGTGQNFAWMRQLFQTVQGSVNRNTATNFRVDVEIEVLSHPIASSPTSIATGVSGQQKDHVAKRFKIYNAWITSLAYSDLNAGDNAILVEQMQLVHEGWDTVDATSLTMAGSAKWNPSNS